MITFPCALSLSLSQRIFFDSLIQKVHALFAHYYILIRLGYGLAPYAEYGVFISAQFAFMLYFINGCQTRDSTTPP